MSRANDFSKDLAIVSEAVKTDVDTIIKLVREKDEGGGDLPTSVGQADQDSTPAASDVVEATPIKPIRRGSSRIRSTSISAAVEVVALENVTTRLRRDTNERLTEAALRQRLKKVVPATRQDIIEEALQEWFRRYGYA